MYIPIESDCKYCHFRTGTLEQTKHITHNIVQKIHHTVTISTVTNHFININNN